MSSHTAKKTAAPQADFAELRSLIAHLPKLNPQCTARADDWAASRQLPQAQRHMARFLSAAQSAYPAKYARPRLLLFAGNHAGASEAERAEAGRQVAQLLEPQNPLLALCQNLNCDVRLYEMDLSTSVRDFQTGPAMGEQKTAEAIAYGMMAVEMGVDCLSVSAFGGGTRRAATALQYLDLGLPGDLTATERGALDKISSDEIDPLALLSFCGGRELAALCGAVIAARMGQIPVLLDGFAAIASAALLRHLHPGLIDHCFALLSPDNSAREIYQDMFPLTAITDQDAPGFAPALQFLLLQALVSLQK